MDLKQILGKRQFPRKDDFYNDHGVLICGRCGKPREWSGVWPKLDRVWASCVCDCDLKETLQSQQERELAQKKKLAAMHRNWAFPNFSDYSRVSFSRDDGLNQKASAAVKSYSKKANEVLKTGKNLVLLGEVGTGKTFFAAACINALIDEGYSCLFTSFFHEIAGLTQAKDKTDYLKNLSAYDFVAFDDFGAERDSDYNLDLIYQLINARYVAGRPSIFTTNLSVGDFNSSDINKKRIYSRLFDRAEVVAVLGQDRRRTRPR